MTLTDQLAQELPPSGRYASTEAFLAAFPVSDKVKQVAAKIINSGQVEQAQAAIAALQRHEADGALTVDALAEAAAATLGRPPIDLINAEEEQRIRDLIAARTYPNKWSDADPDATELIPQVMGDGVVQNVLLSLEAE